MDTESQIRDALQLRAGQAPPEGNVLAALYRPKKSRKPLFLAITAATAAAAVAVVAVVATTVGRPSAEAPPAGQLSTTTPTPATTTATSDAPLTLGYSPTWVPDGFTEGNRWIKPDERTQRGWRYHTPSGQSATPMLTMAIEHSDAAKETLRTKIANAPDTDRVTINGAPAVITDPLDDQTLPDAEVVFNPTPDVYVVVTLLNAPDVRNAALRIAESVRPDTTPLRMPVVVGDSSDYLAEAMAEGGWMVNADGKIGGVGYGATLRTSPATNLKNENRPAPVVVTARGLPAEYQAGELSSSLYIKLGPELHLYVSGSGENKTPEQLIAAAEAIEVDPNPDMSWTG